MKEANLDRQTDRVTKSISKNNSNNKDNHDDDNNITIMMILSLTSQFFSYGGRCPASLRMILEDKWDKGIADDFMSSPF